MYSVLLIFALTFVLTHTYQGPFRRLYPSGQPTVLNVTDDPGEPLFLTPYLEQGKLDEAKKLRLIVFCFAHFHHRHIHSFQFGQFIAVEISVLFRLFNSEQTVQFEYVLLVFSGSKYSSS